MRLFVWIVAGIACAVFLLWLSQTYRGRPVVRAFVEDAGPSNRLELIDVPVGFSFDGRSQGYDFHAVAWKTNGGTSWGLRKEISARDFQTNTPNRLWVSEVHSVDARTGTAILKIGESTAPENSPTGYSVIYSWREWNLVTNGEVRLIRVCPNPFEKF